MPPKNKLKRNITGLRNQSQVAPSSQKQVHEGPQPSVQEPTKKNNVLEAPKDPDVIKPYWAGEEDENELEDGEDTVGMGEERWMDREGMQVAMMMLAADCGDDPRDEDWVPPRLRWSRARLHTGRIFI